MTEVAAYGTAVTVAPDPGPIALITARGVVPWPDPGLARARVRDGNW